MVAAGAAPPPIVNCANALIASKGVNERMANWRNVFMKGLCPVWEVILTCFIG
jgi:hypothetical protein